MVKNYLKTAYRNLIRNKVYTSINVFGLALGISCCLIIFLLVKFELSYDSIHSKKDSIYRITGQFQRADAISYQAYTPFPMAEALRNDFPDLPHVTQTYFNFRGNLRYKEENKFMVDKVLFADHEFLNVFDFELVSGNKSTVLAAPNAVVITQTLADRIFANEDPVGQVLDLNNALTLKVTGVVMDPPKNVHQDFEMLVSYKSFTDDYYELDVPISDWDLTDSGATYIVAPANHSIPQLEERLEAFAMKYIGENFPDYGKYSLQPLSEIHFDTRYAESFEGMTTDMSTIFGLSAIGLIVLLAACINFINLSTAQSIKRSKEVGVRKVMGAHRGQLVYQFLGETFIIAFAAAVISVVIVEILMPIVNQILSADHSLNLISDPMSLGFLFSLILLVTILGGVYPAFVLSRFRPAAVLQAKVYSSPSKGLSLRKFLVISQFLIAQVLIISTIVTYNQVDFMKTKSMGFDPELVVNFGTGLIDSANQELFKQRLNEHPGIEQVGWFSSSPTNNGHLYGPFRIIDEAGEGERHRTTHRSIDEHYLDIFGLELIAGTNIDRELNKTNPGVLVSETLLRTAGIYDPASAVGKQIKAFWDIGTATIVGVVKDFHNQSLHREMIPTIFFYNPKYHWRAAMKLNRSNIQSSLTHLERTYDDLFPAGMLNYQFEDQRLAEFYLVEDKIFEAFQIFVGIAIVICCLGLFGLVSFVANQKIKEVGIRKVLGADIGHILILFGNQFFRPLVIAFVLAVPIGYYLMSEWLTNFAYSKSITIDVFVLTVVASVAIAFITVSFHSLKAAKTNPVESLRYE